MGFELLGWMLSYSCTKLLDKLLDPSLTKKLESCAKAWAKSLPSGFSVASRALLSQPTIETEDELGPACAQLNSIISRCRIPSKGDWNAALIERWRLVRNTEGADADTFFQRAETEVLPHLERLASMLETTCRQDEAMFRVDSCDRLLAIGRGQDEIHHDVRVLLSRTPNLGFSEPGESDDEDVEEAAKLIHARRFREAIAVLKHLRERRWSKLTSHARYHVLANLGIAHQEVDDLEACANYFIEAKPFWPEREKARCFEALAYVIRGDDDFALELATGVIEDFPHSILGWKIRIQCSPLSRSFDDVLAEIPSEVVGDAEVQVALSQRALNSLLKKPLDTDGMILESNGRRAVRHSRTRSIHGIGTA